MDVALRGARSAWLQCALDLRPIPNVRPQLPSEGCHMRVESYLNFNGRCDEAIEFYRHALGAEVQMVMRFKDNPEPPAPGMVSPGTENKVMHASLRIGETTVMASDGRCQGSSTFQGISLSLTVQTEAE